MHLGFALPAAVLVCLLGGCAAMRSHDAELHRTLDQTSPGNVDAAILILEDNNRLAPKDPLYYLELGMLKRLAHRYDESQNAWRAANEQLNTQDAFGSASALIGTASSYVISDRLRPYRAHDYEKVMLLTYMALNHLALGDVERARVAIRQTHELEATIAALREKQIGEVEEEARKRGASTSFRELNGYPVETIDNPEVNALRNSYQSALAHYLAGFIYEALGEPSLAAPGYRLANELQPGQPVLEEALGGLDGRVAAPDDGMTEVLFVIGSGSAPALQSHQFRMPISTYDKFVLMSLSFPVMATTSWERAPAQLTLDDGRSLPVAPLTSIDLMARRSLKDEMPSIMLRASIRAATSMAMQLQGQRIGQRDSGVGAALALAIGIGSALLNSADDRTWRTLPAEISIARARLPRGAHSVTLGAHGVARFELSGRYAVIDLRLLRHQVFVHQAASARPQDAPMREVQE